MRAIRIVLIVSAVTLSCNDSNIQPIRVNLTKQELRKELIRLADFQRLISISVKEVVIIMDQLNKLNEDQKNRITTVITKYDSYQQLIQMGSNTEINEYKSFVYISGYLGSGPIRARLLIGLIDNLRTRFDFAMEDIYIVFGTEVSNEISKTRKIISGRIEVPLKCNCFEIELQVYARVLNEHYYSGMSIEKSDRLATIAGQYAFVGCVMACYGQQ